MAFVSFSFAIFVAITVLIYFSVPKKYQWCVLLCSSYFYFWSCSKYLVMVLFLATLVTFFTARWIQSVNTKSKQYLAKYEKKISKDEKKAHNDKVKKQTRGILTLGILLVLGCLLYMKYYNFFITNANSVLRFAGFSLPTHSLLLPIGISFYTLQAIAYMTDVYRKKYEADNHFGKFMLFMSYFPQIVQGPIARHNHLAHQLYAEHSFSYKAFTFGLQLILWGEFKKLVIADRIAIPTNYIFNNYGEYTGLVILLGAIFYGLQVYADFSGGMDIARGISQILGIELELNFKQPYFSTSVEDFWRRWHITLGAWMRDYIFYPLSLSKLFGKLGKKSRALFGTTVGKRIPAFIAMFMVYFLVGFWHGAEWKYIAYGVWNGVFIVMGILLVDVYARAKEKCAINEATFSWHLFQILRTFIVISLGRLFSRAASLTVALDMFARIPRNFCDISFLVDGTLIELGLNTANWVVLMLAIAFLIFTDYLHERGIQIRETIAEQHIVFRWFVYYTAIFAVIIFGVYGLGYDSAAFVYQQF